MGIDYTLPGPTERLIFLEGIMDKALMLLAKAIIKKHIHINFDYNDGDYDMKCIHCGCFFSMGSKGSHEKDCPVLIARQIIDENK